jgi:hypothetical protein|tara:strand:- start:427 stop:561 length:135 start_codon:yes stop_codon:yes gene_type:complete
MSEQEINEAVMNTVTNFHKLPKQDMLNVLALLKYIIETKEDEDF